MCMYGVCHKYFFQTSSVIKEIAEKRSTNGVGHVGVLFHSIHFGGL